MKKPPIFAPNRPASGSFRRLRDGNRYDATWNRISKAMLKANPVCSCDAVATWQGGRVVVVAFAPEGSRSPSAHVDHIQPLNMGGTHQRGNLQSLCHSCHSQKTSRFG